MTTSRPARALVITALLVVAVLAAAVTFASAQGSSDAASGAAIRLEKRVIRGFDADCSQAIEGFHEAVKGGPDSDITWCFDVTNIGSVALRVSAINDETLDVSLPIAQADQILSPQATFSTRLNSVIGTETIINTAQVSGTPVDAISGEVLINPATNEPFGSVSDSNSASIQPSRSDLRLSKLARPPAGLLGRGSLIDYEIQVENLGPDTALGLTLADELPDGLEFASLPSLDGWTCALAANDTAFSCTAVRLRPQSAQTFRYSVRVTQDAAYDLPLTNAARVTTEGLDVTPASSTDEVSISLSQPVPGDITCDGQLDVADALAISQLQSNSLVPVSDCTLAVRTGLVVLSNGDTDGDGTTGRADAVQVLECLVGSTNSFCA